MLVRVIGDEVTIFRAEGSVGALSGARPDALWASGGRELLYFDGAAIRVVPGPGGDVLLAAVHVIGDDELLVLESWGSGSGFGRLHHYRAGVWSLAFDFVPMRRRVEGPVVAVDGGVWLRAFDPGRSRVEVVFFDGVTATVVAAPDQGSGGRLHGWLLAGVGVRGDAALPGPARALAIPERGRGPRLARVPALPRGPDRPSPPLRWPPGVQPSHRAAPAGDRAAILTQDGAIAVYAGGSWSVVPAPMLEDLTFLRPNVDALHLGRDRGLSASTWRTTAWRSASAPGT